MPRHTFLTLKPVTDPRCPFQRKSWKHLEPIIMPYTISLPPTASPSTQILKTRIHKYIADSGLPHLPDGLLQSLEAPITGEQLVSANLRPHYGNLQGRTVTDPILQESRANIISSIPCCLETHRISDTLPKRHTPCPHLPHSERGQRCHRMPKLQAHFATQHRPKKLFTKILASRITPELPGVIHYDQVGFISSREARDS